MSNMKHDAIVQTGIKIHERIAIPEDMIPKDSRVEIDAKINAGYFTTGKQYSMDELAAVRGREWEKWEDVTVGAALEYEWSWLIRQALMSTGGTGRTISSSHSVAVRERMWQPNPMAILPIWLVAKMSNTDNIPVDDKHSIA